MNQHGADRLILAVWRQAAADLRRGDARARRWLRSRAFDRLAWLYDPTIDADTLRASLLLLSGEQTEDRPVPRRLQRVTPQRQAITSPEPLPRDCVDAG